MEAQLFLHWPNSFEVLLFCSACLIAVHMSLPSMVPSSIPFHVLVPTYPCDDLRFLQHSWSDTLLLLFFFPSSPMAENFSGWDGVGWGVILLYILVNGSPPLLDLPRMNGTCATRSSWRGNRFPVILVIRVCLTLCKPYTVFFGV